MGLADADVDAFDAFLSWCRDVGVQVREDAIDFTFARARGGGVSSSEKNRGVCATTSLERGDVLARIPFDACLTLDACGLPGVAETVNEALDNARVEARWLCALACALCVERFLGEKSRWYAYDRVLPRCEKNVVSMWSDDERLEFLAGTEIEQSMRDELAATKREWESVAQPAFEKHGVSCSFDDFHAARTVVSSRAFTMTPTKSGLAPIADAFNHRTGDHDVHVGDGGGATTSTDALCVKVTKARVSVGEEVFNTYGFLGNAKLLNSYGFTQEENPADEVRLSTTNIRAAAAIAGVSGSQIAKRFDWIERTEICAPDASFAFVKNRDIPEDLVSVVWACVASEDEFQKIRHTNRRADAMEAIRKVSESTISERNVGFSSMMTVDVANVISLAMERRMTLYRSQTSCDSVTSNERIKLAMRLVEVERAILESGLMKIAHIRGSGASNKRAKASDSSSAFDLFD